MGKVQEAVAKNLDGVEFPNAKSYKPPPKKKPATLVPSSLRPAEQPGQLQWKSKTCESLLELQRKGTLCDLTIAGSDGEVKAHTCVLAAWSKTVSGLLQIYQQRVTQGKYFLAKLEYKQCKVSIIQEVLETCYRGPTS